ncbi:hypothetical protein LTR70_000410 [Exophiala xenobiotica]|uniref:Uncharacterized protein n=1 Tax=Lithohypha guttulata TaxID=1690604 RepID=A0ABR0KPS5_9EURO|nr:hypothetical protein LTR24_000111 [Lithohypha guttulata]KAK5330580.1 hypothetical protein LTR70_000410 [Exophiala xenobiotica]
MKTPSTARKSDTFLRPNTETRSRLSEPTCRPNLAGSEGDARLRSTLSTPKETLRERLSRVFNEDVKAKRKKSADLSNAMTTTATEQKPSGEMYQRKATSTASGLLSGAASVYSLPLKEVPDRKSSLATARQASLEDFPSWRLPGPAAAGRSIPPRGRAESPVKRSAAKDAVSSDGLRPSPSLTFIRPSPPLRLLEQGNISHRRLQLSMVLKTPLFVGGGTVEGDVKIAIDQSENTRDKSKPLLVSKLSVDVMGVEEVSDGRK